MELSLQVCYLERQQLPAAFLPVTTAILCVLLFLSPVSLVPGAQLSPLPASSLFHQSDRDLSLIIMPKQASLGSTPRLTSVVATPHASGMLHFSVRTTTKKNLLLNATHNPKWWLLSLYALCSPQAWKASIQTASLTGSSDCFDWHKPGH